jgi:molybdopterin-guanine dinucleotide biosynthesis protein A
VWQECWDAGEARLMATLPQLRVTVVDADAEGWPEWWTRPVHNPDDYRAWLADLERGMVPPDATERQ